MSDTESVDYLQTGFDPWSLTVPRLRSILVTHNVQYSSSAKKPQLVELFVENVMPQSKKILAARAKARRTSKGIVDADSQSTASTADTDDLDLMPPPPRSSRTRSPRKSTRTARIEPEEPDTTPVPAPRQSPRKRQSRSVSTQPVGTSDTDTGTDADGSRSTRRSRRTTPAAPVKLEPPVDDDFFKRTPETETVFTHDNPFQSGSPPPTRTPSGGRRKTTGTEPSKSKTPSADRRRTDGHAGSGYTAGFEMPVKRTRHPATPESEIVTAGEEFTPDEQLELALEEESRAASRRSAGTATATTSGSVPASPRPKPVAPRKVNLATPLWVLFVALLGTYAAWYRQEKLAVGYCGMGREAKQVVPDNVQLPEWAVVLVEPQCEPCPAHAYCYADFTTRCEQDFILKPHPLALGGLVPLPPTCEPDGEKVRRVQAVADRAVEELRERRARYECGEPADGQEQPLDTPAVDEQELKETIGRRRSKRMNADEFDDLWVAAIGEVKARDEVEVTPETPEPTEDARDFPTARLSSSSLARLPFTCAVRRSLKLGLARYRLSIGGVMAAALLVLYGRSRYRAHRATTAQIPGLVNLVLERLAAQKELAFEDGGDDAFLFLPNLRDDVLRATHSLAERERIWQRVRAVVEQNSNVRTGQREGANGEVGRAWEWIGPSSSAGAGTIDGTGSRRRKSGRVSWGPDVRSSPSEMLENRAGLHRSWEESRPIY